MFRLLQYYGRFQGVRGRVGGLPGWARLILLIAAIPGIVLAVLSILVFLVSLLALLLLTVPVYRLLSFLTGCNPASSSASSSVSMDEPGNSPGRRKIDVTIIE